MALPFLSSSPFLAPRRQLSTRPLYKCCSQTLYIVCHIHTNCRIGLSGPPVPVRVMVGLDPGLLWAPSAETSFDESRQSLSLLISNFEENVNTRPGESAASAPRQEPGQCAPPSGVGDVDDTLLSSVFLIQPLFFFVG